ncbi:MAG TPA: prepilin peptidase [Candidatus Dormibacteraeota bacterium]
MPPLTAFADVWLGAGGLALGSFAGVLADRLPQGRSVVLGRSECAGCGRGLGVLDLVPVLGYLVRRGRCFSCGIAIPRRYPLIELGCGACMVVSALALGPWPGGLVGVALVAGVATALVALGRAHKKRGRLATAPPDSVENRD